MFHSEWLSWSDWIQNMPLFKVGSIKIIFKIFFKIIVKISSIYDAIPIKSLQQSNVLLRILVKDFS